MTLVDFYYTDSFNAPESDVISSVYYSRDTKEILVFFVNPGSTPRIYKATEHDDYYDWAEDVAVGGSAGRHYNSWIKHDLQSEPVEGTVNPVHLAQNAGSAPAVTLSNGSTSTATLTINAPLKTAVKPGRYAVEWSNGSLTGKPEYTANNEEDAIAQFDTAMRLVGLNDYKVVAVTHYF